MTDYPTPPNWPAAPSGQPDPDGLGVGTEPPGSPHEGALGAGFRSPAGKKASPRRPQCAAINVKSDRRCDRTVAPGGNEHDLCGYHFDYWQRGHRVRTIRKVIHPPERLSETPEPPEPPERVTDAKVVDFPRDRRQYLAQCQAITQRSPDGSRAGAQCSHAALPGHATCYDHLDVDQDRAQIAEQMLELLGMRALAIVADVMENSPSEKRQLEAAEIVLDRTHPKQQTISLSAKKLEERDLDAEIFGITEGVVAIETSRDAQTEEERQLLELAAAQGYEGEFVDDEDEAQQEAV